MNEAVRRLVKEALDVRKLARKMMVIGGTDEEFADIRLEKLTAAVAAVEAELNEKPAMVKMSEDETLELLEELHHYFDNRADVNDGDYGAQEANYEMVMAHRIAKIINDEAIGENR